MVGMVSYSHATGGFNDKDWFHDLILGSIFAECFPDRAEYSMSLATVDYSTYKKQKQNLVLIDLQLRRLLCSLARAWIP